MSDLLSDVLKTLRLRGALFLRGEFTEPWGVGAPGADGMAEMLRPGQGNMVVFHIVSRGRCWIRLDSGTSGAVRGPGILFIPHGNPHILADASGRSCTPISDLLAPPPWRDFPVVSCGGGGAPAEIICGYLHFANFAHFPLMEGLPDLIAVDLADARAQVGLNVDGMKAMLKYIVGETAAIRPGTPSLVFRFAELFLMEVLRHHADHAALPGRGWFAAMRDPATSRALQRLHADPARAWTVGELARASGSSRSTVAAHFKDCFGHGPMEYLTKWRLRIAGSALAESDAPISQIAADVGFASESAFYRAFAREMGLSPGAWREEAWK